MTTKANPREIRAEYRRALSEGRVVRITMPTASAFARTTQDISFQAFGSKEEAEAKAQEFRDAGLAAVCIQA